jgi:hypothetical protein
MTDLQFETLLCAAPFLMLDLIWIAALAVAFRRQPAPVRVRVKR